MKLTKDKLPAPKKVKVIGSIDDDKAVEQKEQERNMAVQAAPFTWRGKELHPFAIDREGDWLMYRTAIGKPSLAGVISDPPAFLSDAIAIVWFCSVDPREWIGVAPLEIDAKIRAWAVDNVASGEQNDIIQLAFDIFNRAHTTQAAIKPSSNSPGK